MSTINLVITDKGYAACFKAQRKGLKLSVTEFVVTDFTAPYTPTASQTALVGPVVYQGPIDYIHVNDRNDKIFRLLVPDTTAPASLHEVGLYCFDGQHKILFAIGIFDPVYVKNTDFQLRIYAYIKAPDQNLSVEFDINEIPVLPTVDTYSQLPAPNLSGCNTYVVKQGHCKAPNQTPVLVTKYGTGDKWAVVNGSLVTRCRPISCALDGLSLVLALGPKLSTVPGLPASDWAMLTVVSGPGQYQARNLEYDSDSMQFKVNPRFTILPDSSSVIELWAGPGCCGGN